jgi:nucleoside-diphosphate-sugar epimerase
MISKIIASELEEIIGEFNNELKSLSGKNILITGGNGFIPSYLVDVFARYNKELENPAKILVINKNPISPNSRLSHLRQAQNFLSLEQDLSEDISIPNKMDIIIHAASRANPASFMKDPVDTIKTNVFAAQKLLDYSVENKVEKFLFFSSGEVYGDNPPKEFIPIPEEYKGEVDVLGKKACYAESKRFAETLCSAYSRQFNLDAKIARIFHTYGPGMREDGKAVTDFFRQAIDKKEIRLKDRGGAKIAFCYVSDMTRGLLRVLFNGKSAEAYNIGNNEQTPSIKELAENICEVLNNGSKVYINENAPLSANIVTRVPNLSKLGSLGVYPKVSLNEGLQRMKMHYLETGVF